MDSLGWAVIHSLWQGVIAAFAIFLFRSMTKDSQASLRCGFQLFALIACLLAFLVTFGSSLLSPETSDSLTGSSIVDLMIAPASIEPVLTGSTTATGLKSSSVNLYTPLLGIFWCIGFLLMASRYSIGFILTHQLKTRGLSSAPTQWQQRFETLVLNAGVFRKVALHVSNRVTGPVTLGFFKPVVLVPASFFTGLPAEQIEAILLHEIAHIRRHDYMINLLQTAIKTVFFYHPAIHYICKTIDEDREKACDDFAVNYTRDPQSLAKGLATIRLNLTPPNFAMAAARKTSPLVQRLIRLTAAEEPRRRRGQMATSVTAVILAAGLYTTTQVKFANAHPPVITEPKSALHVSADERNYHFNTIWYDGRKIVVKIASDNSRWVYFNKSWFDIDKIPKILDSVPALPEAPRMPKPDNFNSYVKFVKAVDQYRVNLDYYIATLEKSDCSKCTQEKLHWAKKQKARISDPHPDFDNDLLWKEVSIPTPAPTPYPSPAPKPAPIPRPAPIGEPKLVELAGGSDNTFYLEGKKYSPSDWEEQIERRFEKLEDKFDADMDVIDDQFEAALEKFEEASEKFSQDPELMQGYFERAQANFAKEVLKTNENRAELKYRFNQDIQSIVEKNVNRIVERDIEAANRAAQRAIAEAEREATTARKFALKEAQRARIEGLREAERIRQDVANHAYHSANHRIPKYEDYGQSMLIKLKSDGVIDGNAKTVDVSYTNGDMYVDGVRVGSDIENNYCAINKAFNIPKTDDMRIEIRPQRITITNYNN